MCSRIRLLLFLLLSPALLLPFLPARAQGITAGDLISAVNHLRASQGLAAYEVDAWLMSYAQEHSEYQAATNTSSHLHSDGLYPQQIGVTENVAGGTSGYLSVDFIINQIWSDAVHWKTMVGYPTGFIGVGVASKDTTTFVTLDVRPGNNPATITPRLYTAEPGTGMQTGTPKPFVPLTTNTPRPDGAIIHIVQNGQALWSIAVSYGVKIDDIRRLNGMAEGSTDIYVGQKLIIHPASKTAPVPSHEPSATISSEGVQAQAQPVATLLSSATPRAKSTSDSTLRTLKSSPSPTITPSPQTTPAGVLSVLDSLPIDQRMIGISLIAIGAIGILVLLASSFRK